jgi:hypothetical protein
MVRMLVFTVKKTFRANHTVHVLLTVHAAKRDAAAAPSHLTYNLVAFALKQPVARILTGAEKVEEERVLNRRLANMIKK